MKKIYFSILLFVTVLSCNSDNNYQKLSDYLYNFERNINNFKVVAFVPVDGCSSCLISTIEYSKTNNAAFLMVLTSISEKTNDYFIRLNKIDESKIINDSHNLAAEMGFVPLMAPRYYLLKNRHIVKSIDLTEIVDKYKVLEEIESFLVD